jgi:L-aspartate oxidase
MREVFNKDAYDYLVIGSGVAGLFTALKAAEAGRKVALVTKAHLEESNTRYAQGGIAAAIAPTDSPTLHIEDTLIAGAGLCDREAVEILCREAPARIAALLEVGVPFDRKQDEISLGREGAHSANRILHAGGDATGFHIEISLCRAVKTHPNVRVFEQTFVEELILEGEQVAGAQLRDAAGQPFELRALVTVLASGGAGQLYTYTTNPEVATGDGLALAYRAGAMLGDLEFYQFHPTALVLPGAPTFLVSEAVRGEGATLRRVNPDGSAGVAFMTEYDPRGDLASRDIVSRAITSEMAKTGQAFVYLDATHLPAEVLRERFPTIDRFCRDHGLDFTVQPLPVAPAAHYFMGGVATDSWGATTVAGLFACGEVACTGVHGANRLASNSLLEGLVFGQRIVEKVEALRNKASAEDILDLLAEQAGQVKRRFDTAGFVRSEVAPITSKIPTKSEIPALAEFQAKMWQAVGLVRDGEGLTQAEEVLAGWAETTEKAAELARQRTDLTQDERRQILELANLTLLGRLMAQAAKIRTESRGGHFRRDFPTTREEWQCRIVLAQPLKVLA